MLMQQFLEVSQASDRQSLEHSLVRVANELEFPLVSAMLVVEGANATQRPAVYSMGNFPDDFKELATKPELAARDPLNRKLASQALVPLTYDQRLYVDAGAGDLWEEQAPFGYRCGVAISLVLPNNRKFALGMDREQALPRSPTATARLVAHLQLLAVHAQAAADRILPVTETKDPEVSLTPREREILRYALDGKSNHVIGQLLHITDHTVKFHLAKVFTKLEVSTRLQAALKATHLKLL